MSAKDAPTFADAIAHAAPRSGLPADTPEAHLHQWAQRLGRLVDQIRRTDDPGVVAGLMAEAPDRLAEGAAFVAAYARFLHDLCEHRGVARPAKLASFEGAVATAAKQELPKADAKKG